MTMPTATLQHRAMVRGVWAAGPGPRPRPSGRARNLFGRHLFGHEQFGRSLAQQDGRFGEHLFGACPFGRST